MNVGGYVCQPPEHHNSLIPLVLKTKLWFRFQYYKIIKWILYVGEWNACMHMYVSALSIWRPEAEVRRNYSQWNLLFQQHIQLMRYRDPIVSFLSSSLALGLQTPSLCVAFIWKLGMWTNVLMLVQQALFPVLNCIIFIRFQNIIQYPCCKIMLLWGKEPSNPCNQTHVSTII